MRHRASRPLIDPWRRLPRAAARGVGAAARTGPTRVSLAVLLTLGTGTGAFVTVSSSVDDSPTRRAEPSAVAAGRAATSGLDAGTATVGEAPSVPFATESLGPITITALPDRPARGTERAEAEPEAGSMSRKAGERPPTMPASVPGSPTTALDDATTAPSPTAGPGQAAASPPALTRTATPEADRSQGRPERSPRPTPRPTATARPSRTATPTPLAPATTTAPPVDTTPPETSLTEDQLERGTVALSFGADEAAWFSCSLDGGAWTSCSSPVTYSGISKGWHTFAVAATDAAGNVDRTPAQTSFHVKGGPK